MLGTEECMAATFYRIFPNGFKKAFPKKARKTSFANSHLELRMFNVGDGEAILLIFPERRVWIIDGGSSITDAKNETLGKGLASYLAERQLVLEALVPSHPHKDHVGAISYLLAEQPKLTSKLAYYRSDDPTWGEDSKWLKALRKELKALGAKL